jgi:hypothetical protein
MQTYGGVEVYIHAFLTLTLGRCEWSASLPGHFAPLERFPRYPMDRRLGGHQILCGSNGEEIISLPLREIR